VESMIRDLVELTLNQLKIREQENVQKKAEHTAEERILDLLLPGKTEEPLVASAEQMAGASEAPLIASDGSETSHTREKLRAMLRDGKLNERFIDLDLPERGAPKVEILSNMGMEEMGVNFSDMLSEMMPKNLKKRKIKIGEALGILINEEVQNLVDMEKVIADSIEKVEQSGIVFLDEIDKIAEKGSNRGPNVSREGVQRDLLPIVEGSSVSTRYGTVRTEHILFIASGAFHTVKPSDLIPEFQGRFPIRVELDSLGKDDFFRILTEPKNALLLQYRALLKTEDVDVIFKDEAVEEIARIAEDVNAMTENIGARRLHTLMERLLEDVLFDAPDMGGQTVSIDKAYVENKLNGIKNDEDLSRYIL